MMNTPAAVVTAFDRPPSYETVEIPDPAGPDESIVEVLAVGLHPRVRSGARGAHYTSSGRLPMIPGVDAVARRADGELIYFAAADEARGTMSRHAVADRRRTVVLPAASDPLRVAAAMNPAMSSWVALRRRVDLEPGWQALVLGATGNAGAMAVQICRLLGAQRVVAAGRSRERLDELAAGDVDAVVQIGGASPDEDSALAEAAAEVDVVIDYLWSAPARRAMETILRARPDRSRPLDWIQIGAVAGPDLEIPSAWLRAAALRIQGSGQGSIAPEEYLAELPALAEKIQAGAIRVDPRPVPLSEVTEAWDRPEAPGTRTVLVP